MANAPVSVLPISAGAARPAHWTARLVNSTIGAKYLVAVTGLILSGFVLFHMLGNLQIFLGREAFNNYAHTFKSMPALLWLARGGLLATLLLHLFFALRLALRNSGARPVRYVYERTKRASTPSRYMAITGVLILLFIVFHLAHFTVGVVDRVENPGLGQSTNFLDLKDPDWKDPHHPTHLRHDAYRMFIVGFRNVPISIFYIVCQVILAMHLIHGVRSAFQTLGVNSDKINFALTQTGIGLTLAVLAGNILMPIAVMTKLIGTDIP